MSRKDAMLHLNLFLIDTQDADRLAVDLMAVVFDEYREFHAAPIEWAGGHLDAMVPRLNLN